MARCSTSTSSVLARALPRLHPLALAAASLAGLAQAQPLTAPDLPKVVTSATRLETPEDEVAASVTTLTDKDIARKQAGDIKDMLRQEVGISVRSQPNRSAAAASGVGRGGNEGINIRGLEGNQVLLQTDGVRLPMMYSSGPVVAGRGDYIDVEAFKQVEILRGSASTSYGSDGLAGAVSFQTKDPSDLVPKGKSSQAALKLGYSSVDNSTTFVPSYAFRGDQFEGLLLASLRSGHESDTRGDNHAKNINRTVGNPQDISSNYLLGKLMYKLDARQRFKLSVENMDRDVDTTVYTLFGDPRPAYATTTRVDANERINRSLVKLDYEFTDSSNPIFQRALVNVYWQKAKNRQLGYEEKSDAISATVSWNSRARDALYAERLVGGSVQFETYLGNQRIVYGLDASSTLVSSLKGGGNYADGKLVTAGSGRFTVDKSFPDTDYRLFGAFIQDEITLGDFTVTPGLRLDRFELNPRKGDPLYTISNPTEPTKLSDQELSPKLGVVWTYSPLLRVFGQYSHGFRAPAPSQVNGGVNNPTARPAYISIGNPNLKPETSDSFELGLRGRSDSWRYSAALFRGRYKDFIETGRTVRGTGSVADPLVFQSVNLNSASIRGVELSSAWNFLPNWTASASYAHTKGDSELGGIKTPLISIDPDKGVLGLRYEQAGVWGAELNVTGMKSQRRNPNPRENYTPKGFVVGDVTAWYEIGKQWSLNVGISNIGDVKYALWSDTRSVAPTAVALDAYTQPGRNLSASVRYQF
ncbi:TonB-dependent hemoglobin/transferrin/lactoferrin family receptor [Paucibacter sp. XJ19-41]|uniref:TonB-dependent hemoglobin/transferrin/lactoferrin family receptor n=1 Tax=Paucibacter sp. XJ19-41 TaxID=2927824 RepID=UPI00234ADAB0|nr:TonB-dependent hemoglobin/transferrin/lactoferrin family receptor [Paucibacter sp. XJ19-41]MDC6170889.1 TonB-dependent hemoglobin/transferrin/lactoferrin family receptor [Paucibacter sp. XJ19-41]